VPHPATTIPATDVPIAPHLRRLLEFAEPGGDDVCLDVARGPGPMPAALEARVRHVTAVRATPDPPPAPVGGRARGDSLATGPVRIASDITSAIAGDQDRRAPHRAQVDRPPRRSPDPLPTVRADAVALPYRDASFSLVTARFSLYALGEPRRVLRELLRVCRPDGRLVIADLVRSDLAGPDRDRIERLRDPDHPGTPSISTVTELITSAGASIRRLDVFTVERPVEPWLAGARDEVAAERIRTELIEEVDGGPRTGAKPRLIGGELWFTQTWAHIAAEPEPTD
jgi:SAM-dependent methyltransferase